MKQVFSILFIAFLSINSFAQTTWNADPAHSQVTFEITHLTIADIKGNFNKSEGSIAASKEDFSDAQYQIFIDVPSKETGVENEG
ncbi:YceI family protein [Gillisia sp. Q332]|uniref:YceI family protein n=1 Tax=Gillisia xinjiangensis TaxID=3384765 RepID=UPI00391AB848